MAVLQGFPKGWAALSTFVAAVLETVRSPFPGNAWAHAYAVGHWLPAPLADWLYFEDTPDSPEGPLNFTVGVGPCGRRILMGRESASWLPAALSRHPVWRRIDEFARIWSDSSSSLRDVERIWLEFDAPADAASCDAPIPGTFVDFHPSTFRPPALQRTADRVLHAITLLQGYRPDRGVSTRLRRLVGKLPPGAVVPYVGSFRSRGTGDIRVCILGVSTAQVCPLLAHIGWPGNLPLVAHLVHTLDGYWTGPHDAGFSTIHLDVGREIGPSLGLEYAFSRRSQLRGTVAEVDFLDELAGIGLLSRDRIPSLMGWPACTRVTLPHQLWPSLLSRRIGHIKIVVNGAQRFAKTYLSAHAVPHARRSCGPKRPLCRDPGHDPEQVEDAPLKISRGS